MQVCVDKKCSPDLSGRHNRPVLCPANCTNGGFCNNLGKCHCPDGFNPPLCQRYGMGGSEDGGPSLDPKGIFCKFNLVSVSEKVFSDSIFLSSPPAIPT